MTKIKKAIIPVAGLGTRMLPATKAIPKEMLPLADKPLIQYIVNECINAGIKDIILVTHSSKNSIENHFDTSFELESILEKRVKRALLREIRSIIPSDVNIMHIRQGIAKGLGHAILTAYPLVGDEPVAILLPDVVINERVNNLAIMLKNFDSTGFSQIMVEHVAKENIDQYGIVNCENNDLAQGQNSKILTMIEKPSIKETSSQLAIVGRYILSKKIWPLLQQTEVGRGNEIQLTDAMQLLLAKERVEAYHFMGKSNDCGNKLGYFKAFFEYCCNHPSYGNEFKDWLITQSDNNLKMEI